MNFKPVFFWGIVLSVVLLGKPSSVYAQIQPYRYKFRITYKMTFQPDSTNSKNIQQEFMGLFVGDHQSFFSSLKYIMMDSAITSEAFRGNAMGPSIGFFEAHGTHITMCVFKTDTNIYFYDQAVQFIPTVYTYSEPKSVFHWKVSGDTMTINSLFCQKATVNYGNRKWIAWFATDIPISDGPYKFCGLPGLIIKVSDSQNTWNFQMQGVARIQKDLQINFNNKKPKTLEERKAFLKIKTYDKYHKFQIYKLKGWTFSNPLATKKEFERNARKKNNWIELYKPKNEK